MINKIKEIITEFFKKIDNDIKVDFSLEEDTLIVNIRTKEPQSLIGEKGQTLTDIERLLKMIIRKKENIFLDLDINNYKKKKADYLEYLAKEAATEVFLTGIEKKFPPMSAYERRIVHMAIAEEKGVTTESIEDGSQKIVVVRKSNNQS